MLLRQNGRVEIIQHGKRVTVSYRVAVGQISRGRATWAGEEPVAPVPVVEPTPEPPVPAPEPVSHGQGAVKRAETPPKSEHASDKATSKSTVSTPTKRAEGALTEHEPSPPDP